MIQTAKCAEFLTRSGQVGATIYRSVGPSGTTYRYTGKWGAGSGIDIKTMRDDVSYWRANKRGMRETIPFNE